MSDRSLIVKLPLLPIFVTFGILGLWFEDKQTLNICGTLIVISATAILIKEMIK